MIRQIKLKCLVALLRHLFEAAKQKGLILMYAEAMSAPGFGYGSPLDDLLPLHGGDRELPHVVEGVVEHG